MPLNADNNDSFEENNIYGNNEDSNETTEAGSDDLLADDALRLPESANILVRLHAIRAWLTRRRQEATIAIGDAALALQEAFQEPSPQAARLRRREAMGSSLRRIEQAQRVVTMAQQRLAVYEEAQSLLDETISHVTASERVLVEYYLAIEELLSETLEAEVDAEEQQTRQEVLADVLHRIEHVGIPDEEA